MNPFRSFLGAALLCMVAPASAEVVGSSPNAFHLRQTVEVGADTRRAFDAFTSIARWWNKDHTYSGDSANLSLAVQPGGCFCERLPDGGGVEHMRVAFLQPGKRIVLTGSLGPLLYEATSGVMDVRFEPAGTGTRVIMDYKVAGFASGGADKLAPLVDQVLGQQMKLYAAYAGSAR